MKTSQITIILTMLLIVNSHAIGLQHGLFRSQSTQGAPWQGTATITGEHFNITVHPDYLDVEMEWVIKAEGTPPDSFKDALEIVGNLNLADKSVVTGMITWYQGKILKGKLKTTDVAREQYEDVVQRSSDAPPPPRDPVLLERIGDDNYDISIFPVSFNGTRKVRINYLIPAFSINGINKIAYPHAFTANATVSLRKGPDVRSYRIETAFSNREYDNRDPVVLSAGEYTFEAYGNDLKPGISFITPVLAGNIEGSVFYKGAFSSPQFSGEMLHITTMTGEAALAATDMAEDFVILWRWNHPQILKRYARQIVEQSALLGDFLAKLNSVNKRVALIIDKEGGERITFTLDRKGGPAYNRMIAYLNELSGLPVIDPPRRATPRMADIAFDMQKSAEEFQSALNAAIALFDLGNSTLKHLLILTAGPNLVNMYPANRIVVWNRDIDVSMLSAHLAPSLTDAGSAAPASRPYWPGVDIDRFLLEYNSGLSVTATVRNGIDSSEINVLSGADTGSGNRSITGTTQMHLYSDRPVAEEITWRISRNGRVLAEYTEKPTVIRMRDPMQYARLIGGSPHLTPMARQMPSSLASTLGFIDAKYSLVALEEDALPADVAARYENSGVPSLDQADIFRAADERFDVPVAEWLKAHPPEFMGWESSGWFGEAFQPILAFDGVRGVAVAMRMPDMAAAPVAARVATAQALPIYSDDPETYLDYESALAVIPGVLHPQKTGEVACFVNKETLVMDLAGLPADRRAQIGIRLCDLSGRTVMSWNGMQPGANPRLSLPLRGNGLARGTYLLNIRGAEVNIQMMVMIR